MGGTTGAAGKGTTSCSQFAERRAAGQYAADTASLDEREGGLLGARGGVRRDLAELDAESRRRALYRNCMRQRGLPKEAGDEAAE